MTSETNMMAFSWHQDFVFAVQDSVVMVKELFRNKEATEFVIATIPTMLAVNESARLLKSLRKENIPCKRIVVNQVCVCSPLFIRLSRIKE